GGSEETHHHGGSYILVYRRGPEDPRTGREWRIGRSLLLRLAAGQSRTFSARRQRDLGPSATRPVDYGSSDKERAGGHSGDRRKAFERGGRCRVHDDLLPSECNRPHQRKLAFAREDSHHTDRRPEEDAGLEWPGCRREGPCVRQRSTD